MRCRVSSATPGRPLSANETVPLETPAARATSRIVGRSSLVIAPPRVRYTGLSANIDRFPTSHKRRASTADRSARHIRKYEHQGDAAPSLGWEYIAAGK